TDSIVRIPIHKAGSKFDFYSSAAALDGETLYLGTHDGHVLALAFADGARRWSFAAGGPGLSPPAGAGRRVVAGSFDGRVYALDAATGRKVWEHDTGAPVTSTPVPDGNVVVVGSRSYELFGFDAATGKVVWSHYQWFTWVESSARIANGVAYVGSSDGAYVTAVETRSGRVRWQS